MHATHSGLPKAAAPHAVRVDGAALHVEDEGDGPPLLLVHGGGADARIWGEARERLAQGHRVIAYDQRGTVRSPHPPERDHRRHAADAAAILERLGAEAATVVGWSSGGSIALRLALARPDLVGRLVLAEGLFHGLRSATPSMLAALARVNVLAASGREREAALAFFRWATGHPTGASTFDRFPAPWREAMLANAPAILAELRRPHPHGALSEDLRARDVGALRMPVTFLLAGLSDPWHARMGRALTRALPAMETERIAGAGHAIHADAPAAFADAVARAAGRPRRERAQAPATRAAATAAWP